MTEEMEILQRLAVLQQKAEEFRREMEELGIKVKISASLGVYTSEVEWVDKEGGKVNVF